MKRDNRTWNATRRYIGRVLTGILHRPTVIQEAREGELGYTTNDGPICIARDHPLFENLTPNERLLVQLGIAVHESMHKIFTNNLYLAQTYERLLTEKKFSGPFEANMYLNLFNLIEDPAIEMHAHEKTGGTALKALYYAIEKLDELSGEFQKDTVHPMQELCNALVQFGDMGLLHGEFTFPEAKTAFARIAPIFYDAINEPDNRKRVDYTEAIFDECRPLWENDHYFEQDQLLRLINSILAELLKGNAMNNIELQNEGENASSIPIDDSRNAKRKISIRKVSREEFDRLKKEEEESENTDNGTGDIEIVIPDDDIPKAEEDPSNDAVPVPVTTEDSGKEDNPDESSSGVSEDAGCSESIDAESSKEDPGTDSWKPGHGETESETDSGDKYSTLPDSNDSYFDGSYQMPEGQNIADSCREECPASDKEIQSSEQDDTADGQYSDDPALTDITDEEFENILDGIDREYQKIEAEEEDYQEYYSEIEGFNDRISEFPDFDSVRADNLHALDVDEGTSERYDTVVDKLSVYIEPLKDELENIFISDRVKKLFTESGKVYVPRLSGRKTTRVFRRKLQPAHKDDVCFVIAVDNSGSTSGEKNLQEIYSCIGIAEAFAEFDIPLYVFGFNVEHIAVQTHFVRWDNTRFEREHLLCMHAGGCNFDSYSIRYATELLRERPEKNKILIVISDGCPSFYFSNSEGIIQNAKAIEDARSENIHVLGIGVGDVDDECFNQMYSRDYYIRVNEPADLFDNLADRLVKFIDNGN